MDSQKKKLTAWQGENRPTDRPSTVLQGQTNSFSKTKNEQQCTKNRFGLKYFHQNSTIKLTSKTSDINSLVWPNLGCKHLWEVDVWDKTPKLSTVRFVWLSQLNTLSPKDKMNRLIKVDSIFQSWASFENFLSKDYQNFSHRNPHTFHDSGWLIGILMMVCYNPHITG